MCPLNPHQIPLHRPPLLLVALVPCNTSASRRCRRTVAAPHPSQTPTQPPLHRHSSRSTRRRSQTVPALSTLTGARQLSTLHLPIQILFSTLTFPSRLDRQWRTATEQVLRALRPPPRQGKMGTGTVLPPSKG